LTIQVLCPHFERPVMARRNQTTEAFVDCDGKAECVSHEVRSAGVTVAVYPASCPGVRGTSG
jgi:hypothetical protein